MLEEALQQHFSFSTFRPGQKDIIEAILAGQDTLAIMPTGAGKSLCFQFPAVMLPGLTIVVSPLIALMKNQVDSLHARGITATFLNSSLSLEVQHERCQELKQGHHKLLYLAPERLVQPDFMQLLTELPVSLIAIDEAHCISSWGHDFRPEYQQIATAIARLPHRPTIAGFTATATQLVARDIQTQLGLKSPAVFVRGFDRPNLRLFVREKLPLRERKTEALRLIKSLTGSGIIYTLTIKEAEEIGAFLQANGLRTAVYHARLDPAERTRIQDAFMENHYQVIVATVAFGMGIDKADIRYVIHIGMPPNLERYYQEAGRAGRDGELAYCIILHNGRDKATHHYFIQQSLDQMRAQGKTHDEVRAFANQRYDQLETMMDYVSTTGCRRTVILEYFQDPDARQMRQCAGCDRCLRYEWKKSTKTTTPKKDRQAFWAHDENQLSNTIRETIQLYQGGHTPDQIATIRALGQRTIMQHLAQWYAAGGALDYESYVSPEIEEHVLAIITRLGNVRLGLLKEALPSSISYDQIKFVLAKQQRSLV